MSIVISLLEKRRVSVATDSRESWVIWGRKIWHKDGASKAVHLSPHLIMMATGHGFPLAELVRAKAQESGHEGAALYKFVSDLITAEVDRFAYHDDQLLSLFGWHRTCHFELGVVLAGWDYERKTMRATLWNVQTGYLPSEIKPPSEKKGALFACGRTFSPEIQSSLTSMLVNKFDPILAMSRTIQSIAAADSAVGGPVETYLIDPPPGRIKA